MSTNDIGSRLESLEREARRLRQWVRGLAGGVLLLVLGVLGVEAMRWRGRESAAPAALRVRHLTLVDDEGRTRAELGFPPDGREPHLVLFHPEGRPWATLAMMPPVGAPSEPPQASLLLQDEAGKAAVALGASGSRSGLTLHDAQGALGVGLYVEPDARGLVVSDGESPRIHLQHARDEEVSLSRLRFVDEDRRERAVLQAGPGGVSLQLHRPDGQRAFQAP